MDSRCASYSGVGSMAVMVVRLEEKGQMILSGYCKQRLVGCKYQVVGMEEGERKREKALSWSGELAGQKGSLCAVDKE